MTKEELRSFIDNYETVEEKIIHVFEVLQTVDHWYWNTGRYINDIEIRDNRVSISYTDTCGGYESNGFDAEWLFLSDEELIEVAKADKIKRAEEERRKKAEKAEKEKVDTEKREYEKFLKLKKKFEPDPEPNTLAHTILTDDDDKPFNTISEANHLAEIWYPSEVIVATVNGNVLCETFRCNAWQPNGEYSYSFIEKKIKK